MGSWKGIPSGRSGVDGVNGPPEEAGVPGVVIPFDGEPLPDRFWVGVEGRGDSGVGVSVESEEAAVSCLGRRLRSLGTGTEGLVFGGMLSGC